MENQINQPKQYGSRSTKFAILTQNLKKKTIGLPNQLIKTEKNMFSTSKENKNHTLVPMGTIL
jgi:hypothetical protein